MKNISVKILNISLYTWCPIEVFFFANLKRKNKGPFTQDCYVIGSHINGILGAQKVSLWKLVPSFVICVKSQFASFLKQWKLTQVVRFFCGVLHFVLSVQALYAAHFVSCLNRAVFSLQS